LKTKFVLVVRSSKENHSCDKKTLITRYYMSRFLTIKYQKMMIYVYKNRSKQEKEEKQSDKCACQIPRGYIYQKICTGKNLN